MSWLSVWFEIYFLDMSIYISRFSWNPFLPSNPERSFSPDPPVTSEGLVGRWGTLFIIMFFQSKTDRNSRLSIINTIITSWPFFPFLAFNSFWKMCRGIPSTPHKSLQAVKPLSLWIWTINSTCVFRVSFSVSVFLSY